VWDIVPAHMRNVNFALEKIGADPLPLDSVLVSFGSWIGGDRDGNPFVTAELTREIIKLSRWRAAELYYREVDKLLFQISMAHCSDELRNAVASIPEGMESSFKTIHFDFAHGNIPPDEVYRRCLAVLRERLKLTYTYLEVRLVYRFIMIESSPSLASNILPQLRKK
jgi:phosphoenolpyruvate carboxylase